MMRLRIQGLQDARAPGPMSDRDLSPQGLRDFGDGRPRGTQDYPTLAKIYAGLG